MSKVGCHLCDHIAKPFISFAGCIIFLMHEHIHEESPDTRASISWSLPQSHPGFNLSLLLSCHTVDLTVTNNWDVSEIFHYKNSVLSRSAPVLPAGFLQPFINPNPFFLPLSDHAYISSRSSLELMLRRHKPLPGKHIYLPCSFSWLLHWPAYVESP